MTVLPVAIFLRFACASLGFVKVVFATGAQDWFVSHLLL